MLSNLDRQDECLSLIIRKKMRIVWIIVVFTTMSYLGRAQHLEDLDSISTLELIDTLFIDRDLNNWSFRLYTNVKEQRVRISNGESNVSLIPNNPNGVGIGVATRKLVLDIGFNVRVGDEHTDRFDLQGHFMPGNHQFEFFYQQYQGFNVRHKESGFSYFRNDIKLQSSGIRYLYMFNANEYSFSSLKTGLARQKKSSYSLGVGGFFLQLRQRADSAFIDNQFEHTFNDPAYIINSSSVGLGGSLGFSAVIVLPGKWFLGLGINAGLGLHYNKVETIEDSYVPENPMMYHLGLMADLGYNGDNVYINLSVNDNLYGTDLDFGNRGLYNQINAKLAIGLKYGRNKLLK